MLNKLLGFLFLCNLVFAQSPVPEDAVVERIAAGFNFTEGPLWSDSLGLLFSDINTNRINRWSPEDSSTSVFLNPSESSNGLTFDHEGRLVLTQMKLRRIARMEDDGNIVPLVSTYNGKKFNSPNDLVVKSDGSVFFTDPDWNIPQEEEAELSFQGVFRLSPEGSVSVLDSSLKKPNGICFSPDENRLYVNESVQQGGSWDCRIYVWDAVNDSTFENKRIFYDISTPGIADGMKTDPDGNVYCTGPTGVWVISPSGELLDKIAMPQGALNPSNCNWGDEDRKTLFITAGNSVYKIRLAGETTDNKDQGILPGKYKLHQNYPNPFNPKTSVRYEIGNKDLVTLKIYDMLGNEVSTLVNEEKEAGKYKIEFNADELSSGVYFYKLDSGSFSSTKKFVLLK